MGSMLEWSHNEWFARLTLGQSVSIKGKKCYYPPLHFRGVICGEKNIEDFLRESFSEPIRGILVQSRLGAASQKVAQCDFSRGLPVLAKHSPPAHASRTRPGFRPDWPRAGNRFRYRRQTRRIAHRPPRHQATPLQALHHPRQQCYGFVSVGADLKAGRFGRFERRMALALDLLRIASTKDTSSRVFFP